MTATTPPQEPPPPRRRNLRSQTSVDDQDRHSAEEIAAEAGVDPQDLDEDPLTDLHLRDDDEELGYLSSDALSDETPVPDDAHLDDFERQGRVRKSLRGPPNHERLSARPEELGARFLEGVTQTDPTSAEEERELLDEMPNDKELDIRGGEEEPAPEERPAQYPSSPTGSPPD